MRRKEGVEEEGQTQKATALVSFLTFSFAAPACQARE